MTTTQAPVRVLMEGSEAVARAAIAAGCRFFAGYPMTPFTEVLEHFAELLPDNGGVCIDAESELEAVGMASGALATGARRRDRLDGPGPLAHAGVVLRDHAGRASARHLQHGPRPTGLLPGHAGRRSRRLPPYRSGAPGRRAKASSTCNSRSTSPTSGAPGVDLRRLPARAHAGSELDRADLVPRAPPQGLGRRRVALGKRPRSGVTPARRGQDRSAAIGQEGKAQYIATKIPLMEREVRVEHDLCDDAETIIVAFGSPAKFVKYAIDSCAKPGRRSATSARSRSGRSRTPRSPTSPPARTSAGSAASSSRPANWSRTCVSGSGDTRRHLHRRGLHRPFGLRRRPPARCRGHRRPHPRDCTKTASSRSSRATRSSRTRSRRRHQL